jgi:DNA-nicking Smr family endonuclease
MSKLKLDLHDIYNKGDIIKTEIMRVIDEAYENNIPLVEIIHGKGKGQLKKNVIRFLQQPYAKNKYHRLDKDANNHGRLFLHFKKRSK